MFQITFVEIKCQNMAKNNVPSSFSITYIYVNVKQHTYSDLYLLKYIKE